MCASRSQCGRSSQGVGFELGQVTRRVGILGGVVLIIPAALRWHFGCQSWSSAVRPRGSAHPYREPRSRACRHPCGTGEETGAEEGTCRKSLHCQVPRDHPFSPGHMAASKTWAFCRSGSCLRWAESW